MNLVYACCYWRQLIRVLIVLCVSSCYYCVSARTASFALELGSLPNLQHGVSGTLHVDDDVTIRIENFHYDGLGPSTWITFVCCNSFLYFLSSGFLVLLWSRC